MQQSESSASLWSTVPATIYCEMVPKTETILTVTLNVGTHEDRIPSEKAHLGLETWQEPSS